MVYPSGVSIIPHTPIQQLHFSTDTTPPPMIHTSYVCLYFTPRLSLFRHCPSRPPLRRVHPRATVDRPVPDRSGAGATAYVEEEGRRRRGGERVCVCVFEREGQIRCVCGVSPTTQHFTNRTIRHTLHGTHIHTHTYTHTLHTYTPHTHTTHYTR